jgi:hypothetical protein
MLPTNDLKEFGAPVPVGVGIDIFPEWLDECVTILETNSPTR